MASYTLHIQYVDRPAETRTFTQPKVTLGRDSGDIPLHDTQVSGRHGEILWDGTTLRYTDLGSTNGSFLLQGQRVANIELTPGIALRLGNSLITVQSLDGAAGAKGRTVIAGPGMVPGFPAPMRPPGPGGAPPPGPAVARPPGAPQGGFAFAPTAQLQNSPVLRPPAPQPGGPPAPGGFASPPAPMPAPPAPAGFPQPAGYGAAPQPPAHPPAPQSLAQPPSFMPASPAPVAPPAPAYPPMGPSGTLAGAERPGAAPSYPPSAAPSYPPSAPPSYPSSTPPLMAQASGPQEVVFAPPGGEGAAAPAGDLVSAVKQILGEGWKVLEPVVVNAVGLIFVVIVPLAVLGQLFVAILGPTFGGLLALVCALAQLAGIVIAMPSLARYLLGSYLGQPISLQAAVQEQIQRAADVAVNCFVPGLVLGVFAAPIYFVEGRKVGDVISRNFSLLGRELVPILVTLLTLGLAVGVAAVILGVIFGLLPLGWLLSSIVINTMTAVLIAFSSAISIALYFGIRRKYEGGDPEAEARARLGAAQTALPQV